MAKEKCPPCPPTGAPDWMVTYGDLMTLLLCFFVLLFSFSEMDKLQFESMKDSFTGAFGVMDGHSVRQGRGVSHQTQRYTTVLFDTAVEKIRKASSDKFPHEQLEYLNSTLESAEIAIGMLKQEAIDQGVAVQNLESILKAVREKRREETKKASSENKPKNAKETFNARQVEPRAEPSDKTKLVRMKEPSVSETKAQMKLDQLQKQKNLEKNVVEEVRQARGDQNLMQRGDASRNFKNMGRNQPLIGNPGEGQIQKDLTGHELTHQERMDRVEGRMDKKRFEFPVPQKITSDSDFSNISGQVKETQSDANRAVTYLPLVIDSTKIFYPKSDRLRPEVSNYLGPLMKSFQENVGGYFQIEAFTDEGDPGQNYSGNRDLTNRMAIALILKILEQPSNLSPSRFAAVGWGSSKPPETGASNLPNRIMIRWVKRGKDG